MVSRTDFTCAESFFTKLSKDQMEVLSDEDLLDVLISRMKFPGKLRRLFLSVVTNAVFCRNVVGSAVFRKHF